MEGEIGRKKYKEKDIEKEEEIEEEWARKDLRDNRWRGKRNNRRLRGEGVKEEGKVFDYT